MCSSVTEENPSMLVIMLSKQVEVVLLILVGSFIVTMRPKLLIVEINVLAFRVFDNKSMLKSPANMISAFSFTQWSYIYDNFSRKMSKLSEVESGLYTQIKIIFLFFWHICAAQHSKANGTLKLLMSVLVLKMMLSLR